MWWQVALYNKEDLRRNGGIRFTSKRCISLYTKAASNVVFYLGKGEGKKNIFFSTSAAFRRPCSQTKAYTPSGQQCFLNYKTEWNKTLKGLEQFRKRTPFYSIVPLACCGYFSMPSVSSTLWLLITYPFKLLPPETHFSLLYLCRSATTYQQLQRGVSGGGGKFLPVAQHANTPLFFAAQALYCSFMEREVLCCSGINSWGDPSPTISLSVRPLWLKGGEAA